MGTSLPADGFVAAGDCTSPPDPVCGEETVEAVAYHPLSRGSCFCARPVQREVDHQPAAWADLPSYRGRKGSRYK